MNEQPLTTSAAREAITAIPPSRSAELAPDTAAALRAAPVLGLARIADVWVTRLALGAIRYDPSAVQSRVTTPTSGRLGFTIIFNGNRKARLAPKVA